MTFPTCPRCGAPLFVHPFSHIAMCYPSPGKTPCLYGHDAPRALVPQPDVVGVAPDARKLADDLATGNSLYGAAARRSTVTWRDHMAERMTACGWVHRAHPAPTPQRTDAGGVETRYAMDGHLYMGRNDAAPIPADVPRLSKEARETIGHALDAFDYVHQGDEALAESKAARAELERLT